MSNNRITTAVLLAAGTGNRLKPYTNTSPKCLIEAGGATILEHMIAALEHHGFRRLVIGTGFEERQIREKTEEIIKSGKTTLKFEFVNNEEFATTNNIYSLWKIIPHVSEGFLLLESDLIFDISALRELTQPDFVALDKFNPDLHNGTTATIDPNGFLQRLYVKEKPPSAQTIFKTVNITSFSRETWVRFASEIDRLVRAGDTNIFYELALRNLIDAGEISLRIADFSRIWWDEIDTAGDLERVNSHLATTGAAAFKVKTDEQF